MGLRWPRCLLFGGWHHIGRILAGPDFYSAALSLLDKLDCTLAVLASVTGIAYPYRFGGTGIGVIRRWSNRHLRQQDRYYDP